MKLLVRILCGLTLVSFSVPARAQDSAISDSGLYMSFAVGGSEGTFSNSSWEFPDFDVQYHSSYSLAGLAAVGYQWSPPQYASSFRMEIEGSYRRNPLYAFTGAGVDGDADGYLEAIGILANGYLEFNIGKSLVTYLGTGIGVARASRRDLTLNGVPFTGKFTHTSAWQYMFGFGYKLSPGMIVGVDFRQMNLSEFTWPNSATPIVDNAIEFSEALLTLRLVY